jgi:hypothetical protein
VVNRILWAVFLVCSALLSARRETAPVLQSDASASSFVASANAPARPAPRTLDELTSRYYLALRAGRDRSTSFVRITGALPSVAPAWRSLAAWRLDPVGIAPDARAPQRKAFDFPFDATAPPPRV